MKKQILQWGVLMVFLVSVASCSSSRNTSSSKTPNGTRTSKSKTIPEILFPDGRRTTTANTQGLPPGQAKKINGDQSAKAYAPGQQKKANNTVGNGNSKAKKSKGKKK